MNRRRAKRQITGDKVHVTNKAIREVKWICPSLKQKTESGLYPMPPIHADATKPGISELSKRKYHLAIAHNVQMLLPMKLKRLMKSF